MSTTLGLIAFEQSFENKEEIEELEGIEGTIHAVEGLSDIIGEVNLQPLSDDYRIAAGLDSNLLERKKELLGHGELAHLPGANSIFGTALEKGERDLYLVRMQILQGKKAIVDLFRMQNIIVKASKKAFGLIDVHLRRLDNLSWSSYAVNSLTLPWNRKMSFEPNDPLNSDFQLAMAQTAFVGTGASPKLLTYQQNLSSITWPPVSDRYFLFSYYTHQVLGHDSLYSMASINRGFWADSMNPTFDGTTKRGHIKVSRGDNYWPTGWFDHDNTDHDIYVPVLQPDHNGNIWMSFNLYFTDAEGNLIDAKYISDDCVDADYTSWNLHNGVFDNNSHSAIGHTQVRNFEHYAKDH